MLMKTIAAAALLVAAAAGSAHATQFASYTPDPGSVPNISLTGGTLSSDSPVTFNYQMPGSLAALGDLAATLSLTATQDPGAAKFGGVVYGDYDGTFSINYSGPDKTVGGVTVTTGEVLLSGEFGIGEGGSFTGKGSTATLQYSLLGGDYVNYDNNKLVSFIPPGGDEGLTIGIVNISSAVALKSGKIQNFKGVSNGLFAADYVSMTAGGAPEPATWALMLVGFGVVGAVVRRRAKVLAA